MCFITTHIKFLSCTFLVSKQQTQSSSLPTSHNVWGGNTEAEALSTRVYVQSMPFWSEILLCLPFSFVVVQSPMASPKPQYSWRLYCLLSSLPISWRRWETPDVEYPCCPSPIRHTPPACELLSLLVVSQTLTCHVSAGSHLFAHTQDHSLSQRTVCPHTSLPELWTNSSFLSLDQPTWKRVLWQRENKWVYWEERAKELWKKTLRCLCLCLYTKMQ